MNKNITGIIFDMDNTLLRSNIDFDMMKQETFAFLVARGIVPAELNLNEHTSSTIIEQALQTNLMTAAVTKEMWAIPEKYELLGMRDAKLEPGVTELLDYLKGRYKLVVLTNNAVKAAEAALRDNDILQYFDCLLGREMMQSLKPSPDGFLKVLERYSETSAANWVSIGDAWVDGKASIEAGIKFIAYRGDTAKMNRMGVYPTAQIMDIRELMQHL